MKKVVLIGVLVAAWGGSAHAATLAPGERVTLTLKRHDSVQVLCRDEGSVINGQALRDAAGRRLPRIFRRSDIRRFRRGDSRAFMRRAENYRYIQNTGRGVLTYEVRCRRTT